MYDLFFSFHESGQIIATSHEFSPQNVAEVSGNPRLFQGIPGWWNINHDAFKKKYRTWAINNIYFWWIFFLHQDSTSTLSGQVFFQLYGIGGAYQKADMFSESFEKVIPI